MVVNEQRERQKDHEYQRMNKADGGGGRNEEENPAGGICVLVPIRQAGCCPAPTPPFPMSGFGREQPACLCGPSPLPQGLVQESHMTRANPTRQELRSFALWLRDKPLSLPLRPRMRRQKPGPVLPASLLPPGEPGLRMTRTSEERMEGQRESGSLGMALSSRANQPRSLSHLWVFQL